MNEYPQVPEIHRDHRLIALLIPAMLVGAEQSLDQESRLFLRVLVRLVDKSFDEYTQARVYIMEEMRTEDRLAHRFVIINHLENSLNALNRVLRMFDLIVNGKNEKKGRVKKQFNLFNALDVSIQEHIKKFQVSELRNRIEHLDEDIFYQKVCSGMFLDTDETYQKICVQGKCISIAEFARGIEETHSIVALILSRLR